MTLSPPAFWCDGDGDARERRVTWIELFFDLVFVAAVAQVGTPLVTDYGFAGLARYAFLLFVLWWAWSGHAMYATRFDADDPLQRGLTLLQMIAVIFMAANAEEGLDSVSSAGFAAAYAVVRGILVVQYLRAAVIPRARPLARLSARGFGVAALVWLASSFVDTPTRYALWAVAIVMEIATATRAARHIETLPPHAAHLPERFGLFTLILLGESIVAIMKGIQAQPDWSPSAALAALSGIVLTFVVWWAYFERAKAAADRPIRSRRDRRAYHLWTYTHVPLYLGLVLTAIGVEHIIKQGSAVYLHAEEAALLAAAIAVLFLSLAVLQALESRLPSLHAAAGAGGDVAGRRGGERAAGEDRAAGRAAGAASA